MLRDVQPWPARAVCHPRPRARSFATLHHTTQLSGLPFSRGIPLPPACTVYRPRPLTPWPEPSKAAGSMPVTGRALLGLSRLAVSNRLQPVSLRYANHASLHQPCTRRTDPERGAQRRADTNARLTLGHLTWPIALSDRTGLPPREEKPHRVQPGSTRVYTRA